MRLWLLETPQNWALASFQGQIGTPSTWSCQRPINGRIITVQDVQYTYLLSHDLMQPINSFWDVLSYPKSGHRDIENMGCAVLWSCFSRIHLGATLWTVAQASLSWDSLDKNTGVDFPALLQMIFLIQGSNPDLLHGQANSLPSESPGKSIDNIGLFVHIFHSRFRHNIILNFFHLKIRTKLTHLNN